MSVEVISDDETGALDPAALEQMIDERVRLIAITWLPTNGGLVNPASSVGSIARAHNIPYLLDACQAVGQMHVDLEALDCDMLAATGRKFLRAPRGTGFLFMRKSLLSRTEPLALDVFSAQMIGLHDYSPRPDARRFETWETNYATRLGLLAAADYALSIGIGAIEERCLALAGRLRAQLREVPGATCRDLGRTPSAIVSFTLEGMVAKEVMRRLGVAAFKHAGGRKEPPLAPGHTHLTTLL